MGDDVDFLALNFSMTLQVILQILGSLSHAARPIQSGRVRDEVAVIAKGFRDRTKVLGDAYAAQCQLIETENPVNQNNRCCL